ncbi:hypothetical protein B9Z55_021065 [Caenorhabditis nigoni]|uniref:Uncharacterized protein n=1 Tax=Caenorhabditis nigoni TaxID=1611254 RepID=A0A2G5TQB7_9PELO|nr:hypothetical protein B9Z55_021065 [Caenorhabditis nigoni]
MNEAVIKDEIIEETCNFTFKNGEYVEIKREEVEQKPEHLLEQEIKTEMNDDFFETNEPDEYFEDVTPEPEEKKLKCQICRKRMPRSLLTLIKSEDNKNVLFEIFKIEGFLEIKLPYVCISHIQTIIDDYDGKLKFGGTPFERHLRSFIRINKSNM